MSRFSRYRGGVHGTVTPATRAVSVVAGERMRPAAYDRVAGIELREFEPAGLSDGVSDSEITDGY